MCRFGLRKQTKRAQYRIPISRFEMPPFASESEELADKWQDQISGSRKTEELDAEQNTMSSAETSFNLTTPAGILAYTQAPHQDYTSFVRVVTEMMISFNSSQIDHLFRAALRKALFDYDNGRILDDEDDESDFARLAFYRAAEESEKIEEAQKYVTTLPKVEKLTMQILSIEDDEMESASKALERHTDMPPPELEKALRKNQPFTLTYDKAIEAYIALRTLGGVMVNIKAFNGGKKAALQNETKPAEVVLTGREKMRGDNARIAR